MSRQIRLHRAGLGVSIVLAALAGCGGGAAVAVASVPPEAGWVDLALAEHRAGERRSRQLHAPFTPESTPVDPATGRPS